jgi:hypothetical protein
MPAFDGDDRGDARASVVIEPMNGQRLLAVKKVALNGGIGSAVPQAPLDDIVWIGKCAIQGTVCTENLIRVADVMESPKLAE